MKRFVERFADRVTGVLNGFDRLVIRGSLRGIVHTAGMMRFLWENHVYLKDFGEYAHSVTEQVKSASCQKANQINRRILYLESSNSNKEEIARKLLFEDTIEEGLIGILSCLELSNSFDVHRNRETKRLELVRKGRKCLHLYHYFLHHEFGFMSARIQTWFPFDIQICLNGREWLARQMDKAGIRYRRRENCFTWIYDPHAAQKIMQKQLDLYWPKVLESIARKINPAHTKIFKEFPQHYYWIIYQSEWATDLMFQSSSALAEIFPALVTHGITHFSSPDVLRFLGRKLKGVVPKEIVSDFKDRPEGVRIKHRAGNNSVKLYDKQGSVLRVETTINDPLPFKVFRPNEKDPQRQSKWQRLRKSVADIKRRAEVSQACNDRYLDALADVDTSTPLSQILKRICTAVTYKGKRVRALRPWSEEDLQLFQTVSRGEFCLNGFRNRDLQPILFQAPAASQKEKQRRSSRVSRLLRMLRAHHLIQKIPRTYRYKLTRKGSLIINAILASQRITLEQINNLAA